MTDLTHILGANFRPPTPDIQHVDPPEVQLQNAMREAGIENPPMAFVFDGEPHRFNPGSRNDKSGWYILFDGEIKAGTFGDFRNGISENWHEKKARQYTIVERAQIQKRTKEAMEKRRQMQQEQYAEAATKANNIWLNATPAESHPYLKAKDIQAHGARVSNNDLILPMFNDFGELSSLQFIKPDGFKKFMSGGKAKGAFMMIGSASNESDPVYLAEGFATAATVHEQTGQPCFVSFSAHNMPAVAKHLRDTFGPSKKLFIVADNDESGTGQRYAEQAKTESVGEIIIPPETGDVNDYWLSGGDAQKLLKPQTKQPYLMTWAEIISEPQPIDWLIDGWLESESLSMMHGKSGNGKSFVAIDMALHIASAMPTWNDCDVSPGPVVYLAGEGYSGLQSRFAAWNAYHKPSGDVQVFLSRHGTNLDTTEGLTFVIQSIQHEMQISPALVIVDTLHRFLAGNENDAQDTKKMLDHCDEIKRQFNCAVMLVHHTGNDAEKQGRARGSSAWRGAMETDISIQRNDETGPITIKQTKSKNGEIMQPLTIQLEKIEIPGRFDKKGNPLTSCVVDFYSEGDAESVDVNAAANAIIESGKDEQLLQHAWTNSGCELVNGMPYITDSVVRESLQSQWGLSNKVAYNYTNAKQRRKLYHRLIEDQKIVQHNHGIIVASPAWVLRFKKLNEV